MAGNGPLSRYVSVLCTSSPTCEDIIISSLHRKNLSPGDTKFPKFTQLLNGKAGIQTRSLRRQSLESNPITGSGQRAGVLDWVPPLTMHVLLTYLQVAFKCDSLNFRITLISSGCLPDHGIKTTSELMTVRSWNPVLFGPLTAV